MQKVQAEIELKYKEAVANLNEFQKEYDKLQKELNKANGDLAKSIKNIEGSSNLAAKGVRKISGALKAAGIGLAVAAFAQLKQVFEENQKVADFFSITFETLSLAFNDFFNFLDANVGTVIKYFKGIFDDPVQAILDFGNAIYDNLINRFVQLGETLGLVGDAISLLFEGRFVEAQLKIKEAAIESIDVFTGVDNTLEKVADTVSKATDGILGYAKSTLESASSIVELNKASEKAAALNQGLMEDYDRQAEQQRQLRDNEFNTINDRIKANDKLKVVLLEQQSLMKANAQAIVDAARAQFDKNDSDANAIALQEALNEQKAIDATITGFMSEQDSNANALKREALELEQSNIDATAERQIANQEFINSRILGDYQQLLAAKELAEKENKIETDRLTKKRDLYKQGTQAYADANNELLAFQQENANQQQEIDELTAQSKLDLASNAFADLATIFGEESKAGKLAAIAQTTIETYKGATAAYASLAGIPIVGPALGAVAAGAAVAAGIANVKKIQSTGPSISGGSTSVGSTTPQPPSFNVVGASPENQLAQAIGDRDQKPVKAFVVSNEVTTAQSLDRNIIDGASIG
jgi:hypothetical protein